ncbi:MAG: IS110 family transposase [Chlorobium sp.]|jgi:transposase|nr:IS110 family transposase [Chlorobium sp.]
MASAKSTSSMPVVHLNAAGIDIGSEFHVVAVPADRDSKPVRTFKSFTGELHAMAKWLQSCRITTIAMESTGVYWIPAYEILESYGFEVFLVNARESKNVPGRKSDINDAQWLQKLHQFGLLRASFRPSSEIAEMRAYLRQRERLIDYKSSHIQHMQKAMMQMNVQLGHVVSEITGMTGMNIIRAIVAGQHDPKELVKYRDVKCKNSEETMIAALSGNYKPEHLFALKQSLELIDFYSEKIKACDEAIELIMQQLRQHTEPPEKPLSKSKKRTNQGPNAMSFDVRSDLYHVLGLDLTEIDGFGPTLALKMISECGADMSRWPTSKHFTSWLCLAPGSKISGGKVLSSKTRKSSSRAATLLRLAATTVGKTNTALGAFYRRLAFRAGKPKAVTATARKLATIFYNMLRYGRAYDDPGAAYYEEKCKARALVHLRKKADAFGFILQEKTGSTVAVGVS